MLPYLLEENIHVSNGSAIERIKSVRYCRGPSVILYNFEDDDGDDDENDDDDDDDDGDDNDDDDGDYDDDYDNGDDIID